MHARHGVIAIGRDDVHRFTENDGISALRIVPALVLALEPAGEGIAVEDNPALIKMKSRDFYWYSPVLKERLDHVTGDLIVSPKTEDELIKVLKACYKHDVPVTPRGTGTGNYGQSMPLQGGVVLHMKHMNVVVRIGDDHLVAQAGAVMADLELAAREKGLEIRLFPSTTATATLGGFIAGGSSGVGAIRWGGLRNPANIRRLRLVTMEAEPRVLDLVGDDIAKAAHAYGVNGVIIEIEIPVDPAGDWVDVLIGAPNFAAATRLAFRLGEDDAITLRMLSTFESAIPDRYFTRHAAFLKSGEALIAVMVARQDLDTLVTAVDDTAGAAIRFRADRDGAGMRLPPAYELAWNHTTLRAIKIDPSITYLQMMLPQDNLYSTIDRIAETFGDELVLHFEFTRFSGKVAAVAMPLLRYESAERLEEVIEILEVRLGVTVFNPHRVTLEEGGMKRTDPAQLEFKRQTDPKGLLNPSKMIAWTHPDWVPAPGRIFLFNR